MKNKTISTAQKLLRKHRIDAIIAFSDGKTSLSVDENKITGEMVIASLELLLLKIKLSAVNNNTAEETVEPNRAD